MAKLIPGPLTPAQVAGLFLEAFAANDVTRYEALLSEDARLRVSRLDGHEAHHSRRRVIRRLREEWSAWPDPALEIYRCLADETRALIEFRIRTTKNGQPVRQNWCAILTTKGGRAQAIDLYCL
ncbi:MAG TPA: nuclear transport factor 2 family protein [Gammaproteobacteria bacterium]|nr:nuclear transport factor 2 family protein [Gammaproteobacteria bacterium]